MIGVHRMRRATGYGLLIVTLAITTSCRSTRNATAHAPASLDGVQALYRVQLAQRNERDSGRLTLRAWSASDFLLDLRDAFGRGLWRLRVSGDTAWIADLQNRRYCALDPDRSLLRTTWAGLSPRRVPRILLGMSPVRIDRAASSSVHASTRQATTSEGEWRLIWRGAALDRWSLWRDGRSVLWWQREAMGGVLSGPSGAQLRWRLKVAEALTDEAESPRQPEGFNEVECEDLALP